MPDGPVPAYIVLISSESVLEAKHHTGVSRTASTRRGSNRVPLLALEDEDDSLDTLLLEMDED